MLIHPWDAMTDDDAWDFVRKTGFGTLVAAGRNRDVPLVVPTQFTVTADGLVVLHLARPNPFLVAVEENPLVLLSVTGLVAYLPSHTKVTPDVDPRLGIPTTYYTSVQVTATAIVHDTAEVLRTQLADTQPGVDVTDPACTSDGCPASGRWSCSPRWCAGRPSTGATTTAPTGP